MNEEVLEFTIFCIDILAEYLNKDTKKVYKLIKEDSDVLDGYIIPCYEPLHSQSKKYIVEELVSVLKERGVI
ncbi:DUF3791 domain-containing protein [Clostridium sp.]|uniref:DUF3791 domain-containing protein n=1 Tax=Clostridium sp. TaxID=1506 RepID=UPI003F323DCF